MQTSKDIFGSSDVDAKLVLAIESLGKLLKKEEGLRRLRVQAGVSNGEDRDDEDEAEKDRQSIAPSFGLTLKEDIQRLIESGDARAAGQLWSADMLFKHLELLDAQSGGIEAAHQYINAFIYRVAAMSPPEDKVIIRDERIDPAATRSERDFATGAGYTEWTVMTIPPSDARAYLACAPPPTTVPSGSVFLVSQGPLNDLETYLPQFVLKLLECARTKKKSTIRGAVTNGREWMFLILPSIMKTRGQYIYSSKIVTHISSSPVLSRKNVSTIAAVLGHWAKYSHEDYDPSTDPFFDVEG
ncbi:hypothetical protein BKA70DRAFT_1466127 [Coprinopsis sp. MPI-PUGE-AT-0042]|nr:hypothetical protein BKA70DRAFT_1466127 [Coprinopsis sp. MPI-PUGE-AT-0042]